MQHRIMSRLRDASTTSKPPLRLRVPASLAVALLGASATVAMTFGGCEAGVPDPVDAGQLDKPFDGGIDAADSGSGSATETDASLPEPDAAVQPAPDAAVDASVPDAPDTPDH